MQATEARWAVEPTPAPLMRRLAVTWQHPRTRRYHPVGMLEQTNHGFRFTYLVGARAVLGTRPLLGFQDYARAYEAENLFPLFAARLMDPARPERPRLLEALSLDALAGPLELLARSGGRRTGDSIELIPEPTVAADGSTDCLFLVHGVRHAQGADELLPQLQRGDRLTLVDDAHNPVNPLAVVVADEARAPLGWVPDPLVDYVRHVRDHGAASLRVERANGPELGHHLRLLVHLEGTVEPGYRPFSGPEWMLATAPASSPEGITPVR